MPSLTGRESKLIIPWCLEAKVLIDNHTTALGVYITIRQRDKGWPNALITVVTPAKPDQPQPTAVRQVTLQDKFMYNSWDSSSIHDVGLNCNKKEGRK